MFPASYGMCACLLQASAAQPSSSSQLTPLQEQPISHLGYRHCTMPVLQIPGLWPPCQKLQEVRGGHFLRSTQPQVWHRRVAGRAQERVPRLPLQEQLHPHTEEAEGLLLVQRAARPSLPRCPGARSQAREDGPGGDHNGGQRACAFF